MTQAPAAGPQVLPDATPPAEDPESLGALVRDPAEDIAPPDAAGGPA